MPLPIGSIEAYERGAWQAALCRFVCRPPVCVPLTALRVCFPHPPRQLARASDSQLLQLLNGAIVGMLQLPQTQSANAADGHRVTEVNVSDCSCEGFALVRTVDYAKGACDARRVCGCAEAVPVAKRCARWGGLAMRVRIRMRGGKLAVHLLPTSRSPFANQPFTLSQLDVHLLPPKLPLLPPGTGMLYLATPTAPERLLHVQCLAISSLDIPIALLLPTAFTGPSPYLTPNVLRSSGGASMHSRNNIVRGGGQA